MHEYLPMTTRDAFYTCASGGLGHGLPAAVGLALGRPGEKIIAVLGDGSALYSVQGLWSAAELGLDICFVIINNRRYEALIQFGRHFAIDHLVGTTLPNIDFCLIARGFGLQTFRVSDPSKLDAALREGFGAQRSTLVEINVE